MAGTATKNGRGSRESAEAAVTDAQAQDAQAQLAGADAPAQPDADAAPATDTPAEGTPAAAADPAPEPTPEPEPAPSGRRAAATAAQAATKARVAPLMLAEGCEWHVVPNVGKSGVTVEVDAQGNVREYLTWVPQIGRVHKLPTFGVFPVIDAGDLD